MLIWVMRRGRRWLGRGSVTPTSAATVCPRLLLSVSLLFSSPGCTGSVLLTSVLVLPEGPVAIVGEELSGEYYERAAPVVELLVAKAGYRLGAWLDLIVDEYLKRQGQQAISEEL